MCPSSEIISKQSRVSLDLHRGGTGILVLLTVSKYGLTGGL